MGFFLCRGVVEQHGEVMTMNLRKLAKGLYHAIAVLPGAALAAYAPVTANAATTQTFEVAASSESSSGGPTVFIIAAFVFVVIGGVLAWKYRRVPAPDPEVALQAVATWREIQNQIDYDLVPEQEVRAIAKKVNTLEEAVGPDGVIPKKKSTQNVVRLTEEKALTHGQARIDYYLQTPDSGWEHMWGRERAKLADDKIKRAERDIRQLDSAGLTQEARAIVREAERLIDVINYDVRDERICVAEGEAQLRKVITMFGQEAGRFRRRHQGQISSRHAGGGEGWFVPKGNHQPREDSPRGRDHSDSRGGGSRGGSF